MDSVSFNNLQAEKANAILKHLKFRRITSLLRLVEVCAVLILISRFSLQLPLAVRNSTEYFRDLSLFINSPRFVFLIGNVIIVTLFAQFSAQDHSGRNVPEQDLYQELVQNSKKNQTEDGRIIDYSGKNLRIESEKIKWPEKQSVKTGDFKKGYYRRCKTEILSEKRRRVLRRCDTENNRKSIEAKPAAATTPDDVARISYPEDDMSNEEFRRTVEDFIARQQRIRREEDYYLV